MSRASWRRQPAPGYAGVPEGHFRAGLFPASGSLLLLPERQGMWAPRTVETVRRPEAPERARAAEVSRKTRGSGLLGFPRPPAPLPGLVCRGGGVPHTEGHQGPHPLCPAGPPRLPSEGWGRSRARGGWCGLWQPLPQPKLCPHGECPHRPFPPAVPFCPHWLRVAAPAAEARLAPGPPPGTAAPAHAGRSEGLQAFFGPVCAGALEPTGGGLSAWPNSRARGPYFRPGIGFPLLFPKRKGMWTPCLLAPAVYSETPKRAARARRRGQLGPPGLLSAHELTGFSPGGFKVPSITRSLNPRSGEGLGIDPSQEYLLLVSGLWVPS